MQTSNYNKRLNDNRKKNFVNNNKPKRVIKRRSEYFTQKYDDIVYEERVILAQMSTDEKKHWNINDFRSISVFKNDGKLISDLFTGLNKKSYIVKTETGWKLWHLNKK